MAEGEIFGGVKLLYIRDYCSGRAEIATFRSKRNDQFCQREIANSPDW